MRVWPKSPSAVHKCLGSMPSHRISRLDEVLAELELALKDSGDLISSRPEQHGPQVMLAEAKQQCVRSEDGVGPKSELPVPRPHLERALIICTVTPVAPATASCAAVGC